MAQTLPQILKIKSLRFAGEGGIRYDIKSVRILGQSRELPYKQSEKRFEITLPSKMKNDIPICIEINVE